MRASPIPWEFAHICDMQPGSPRSFRFRPAHLENQEQAYRQIKRLNPEWILVGGDLTRDGSIHDFEFEEARERLDALAIPWRAIPGNMDTGNKHATVQGARTDLDDLALNVTSQQLSRFAKHIGTFPWTFVHKNTRFMGFYEVLAGSGLPEEAVMWDFLESLAALPHATHHVIVTHYPLFLDHPNEPNFDPTKREEYQDWYFCIDRPHRDRIIDLLQRAHADIVLSGHIHCRRPPQTFNGIRYFKCAATGFGQYPGRWPDGDMSLGFYEFTVGDTAFKERFIPLETVSIRTDFYGPGGHPNPDQRDYSLAWVKGSTPQR